MSSEDFIRKHFIKPFEDTLQLAPALRIIKGKYDGQLAIHITGTMHGPSVITMTSSYMLWDECWYALEHIEQAIEHIATFYEMDDVQVGTLTMYAYELKGIMLS